MQTIERSAYQYQVDGGTLYVRIEMAKRTTDTDWDSPTREKIEKLTPRVRIGTDPEFKGDIERGSVKIRGRKYTTEYSYDRLPDGHGKLDRHGLTFHWSTDLTVYNRSRRNDKGKQLDYETKAYGVLAGLEVQVLKQFEKDNPDWKTESIRLRFEYERDTHDVKVASLRKRIEEEEAASVKWQRRIDELLAA